MERIKLLVTGGTIDKIFTEPTKEDEFDFTHIPKMLEIGLVENVDVEVLFLVDSLYMTVKERSCILMQCMHTDYKQIIITHGTDTMRDTAELLAGSAKFLKDKVIVLTGAMKPFVRHSSDALLNLGMAIGTVQSKPPGIYIAINGLCDSWDRIKKSNGRFILSKNERED